MKDRNRIFLLGRDTALLVSMRIIGMAAGMLMTILLTRSLPAAEYGMVAVAQSAALLAGLACSLNLGAAAIRFVPAMVKVQNGAKLATYLRTIHRAVFSVGAVAWVILGTAVLTGVAGVGSEGWTTRSSVLIALFAAPLLAIIRIEGAFTHAVGNVTSATFPQIFVRPVLLLILVAVYATLPSATIDPQIFSVLFVISAAVTAAVQFVFYRTSLCNHIPKQSPHALVPASERKGWFTAGRELLIPVLFLEVSVDVILLLASVALPPAELAVLGVVLRIQGVLLFGVTSINIVAAPRLAAAHTNGDSTTRDALLRSSGHLKLWPSLLLLLLLLPTGPRLLSLFGDLYAEYYTTLLLFSLTPVILALHGPLVLFVTILGLQRQAQRVFLRALAAMALAVPLLGMLIGVNGVAVAVLSVWWWWNRSLLALVKASAGFSTAPFTNPHL